MKGFAGITLLDKARGPVLSRKVMDMCPVLMAVAASPLFRRTVWAWRVLNVFPLNANMSETRSFSNMKALTRAFRLYLEPWPCGAGNRAGGRFPSMSAGIPCAVASEPRSFDSVWRSFSAARHDEVAF